MKIIRHLTDYQYICKYCGCTIEVENGDTIYPNSPQTEADYCVYCKNCSQPIPLVKQKFDPQIPLGKHKISIPNV